MPVIYHLERRLARKKEELMELISIRNVAAVPTEDWGLDAEPPFTLQVSPVKRRANKFIGAIMLTFWRFC